MRNSPHQRFTVFPLFFVYIANYNSCYRISEDEYVSAIKEEISKVVKIQEELDIDVLVHGEPEVSILVYYLCLVFITRLYTWLFEKTILLDLLTH